MRQNDPEPANDGDKIDFIATPFHESFIQTDQARGSETGNDDMRDFGVYTYYTADAFIPGTSTPNFMCNTHVEKTSGTWTYEPLMFWPNNGKLSFFAYSPYASQGDSYTSLSSTPSTAGYPQLTYTVPDDVITQRDLLVSVPLLNQTKTSRNADGKLPLTFRHALSCIVFNAKMTDACDFPVKVTSITLGNFKNKATLSYDVSSTPGTIFLDNGRRCLGQTLFADHQQRTTRGRELENNHEHIPVNQHRQRILDAIATSD